MSAGMQDLYQAMNMFSDSLSGFAKQTAVLNANQKVQDIKDQFGQKQISDQEQQKQLGQVAQGVTAQLTGLGMPVSDITNFVGGFKPRTDFGNIQTPFEGELAGITDPAKIRDLSAKRADQVHQEKMAEIKAKNDWRTSDGSGMNLDGTGGIKDQKTLRWFTSETDKANKEANSSIASSRTVAGKLGGSLQRLTGLRQGILSGGADSNVTLLGLREIGGSLDQYFSGGASTEGGRQHSVPSNIYTQYTHLLDMVQGGQHKVNDPETIKALDDLTGTLQQVAQAQQRAAARDTLRTKTGLAQVDTNGFSKALPEALIKNPDGSPETATYTKDGGIRYHSDDKIQELTDAAKFFAANPNQGTEVDLQRIVNNPFYMDAIQQSPGFKGIYQKAVRAITAKKYGGSTDPSQK